MRNVLLLLLLTIIPCSLLAQTPACCVKQGNTTGMLAFAGNEDFAKAHEAPEPFQYDKQRGSDITFQTLDGKKGRAYYVAAPEATTRTLILFHEWWGLNDYIRREADRLQDSLGPVDVYAIDLYDGEVAQTPEAAEKLSTGLDSRRTDVLIKGLLGKAGRDNQIAMLGWCMGGSYAFRAAVLAEKQSAGCVMYYGFPEKDGKKISPLQTDVLYIRGTKDKFITAKSVDDFGGAVKATGRAFILESYEADHAFANPSNPNFDVVMSGRAEAMALAFLRKHLVL
jgi:carboxymethylenebutenolidase